MVWVEVCIHTTNEALEAVSNILHEAGANGIVVENPFTLAEKQANQFQQSSDVNNGTSEVQDIYIKVYFPKDEQLQKRVKNIQQSIQKLEKYDLNIGENHITIHNIQAEDWETSWQKHYKSVHISDKIKIVPIWDKPEVALEGKNIFLDPGLAFGTGTHPTTKLSILALEKHLPAQSTVIDVGCGSGVLSFAACLLGAERVLALDMDEIAISSTKINRSLNQLDEQIVVKKNDLLKDINLQADVIVANILLNVILELLEDVRNHLRDDGLFIVSGITDQQKKEVILALEKQDFLVLDVQHIDQWVCLIAQKQEPQSIS